MVHVQNLVDVCFSISAFDGDSQNQLPNLFDGAAGVDIDPITNDMLYIRSDHLRVIRRHFCEDVRESGLLFGIFEKCFEVMGIETSEHEDGKVDILYFLERRHFLFSDKASPLFDALFPGEIGHYY